MSTKRKTPAAPPKKRPRGRPSKRTPELCREICDRLSNGEPLAVICREERMPAVSTVWQWSESDPKFSESIARARIEGYDMIASDCMAIADDRGDDPASRRVRTDVRLKLLAKWDPKRYGDRIDVKAEHSGSISLSNVLKEIQAGGLPSNDG
jgi:hypothetical protein